MTIRHSLLRRMGPLLALVTGCHSGASAKLPLFTTSAWGRPGALHLRNDADGQALLLRHDGGAVYRYRPMNKTLAAATTADWEHGGAIAECDRQLPAFDFPGVADGGAPPFAGRVLVTTRTSPTGRSLAIISAAATRDSLMPFLAQGYRGPFMHEVRSPTVGAARGAALVLPFGSNVSALTVCWSADERFVVSTDVLMSSMVVVEVAPKGTAGPERADQASSIGIRSTR